MPNQFLSPEGDLENYLITESWLIDQWVGDTLWGWGRNDFVGQLGINNTSSPICTPVTTFAGGATWKQITSTAYTIGAIKTDGTLWTWGRNGYGGVGDNTTTDRLTPVTTFAGGNDWKQVSGGWRHMSAIKVDGTLWIWGNNAYGQLGTNEATGSTGGGTLTPITTFVGGTNWKQVSNGVGYTAAIKTDGTLWTWGRNTSGQLGDNTTTDRSTPVTTFAGGTNWKQVASTRLSTAAIKTDGTLWTWGLNNNGQLGRITNIYTPVTTLSGGTTWSQVAGGANHTAAIKTDGTLWTWGLNTSGQLGDNTTTQRNTPVTTVAGGTNWKQVACGQQHTAAIKTDGTLWTWGRNYYGQLGDNTAITRSTPVTTFAGGTNWSQVSSGYRHTLAIKTDGTLWTWGFNTSGQLGDNTAITRSTPVTTFAGGTNWSKVACGGNHIAAIKTDGTLWTWGYNAYGQLGDNTAITRSTPVTTFAGGTNWSQVAGGFYHTAAIKTDGTLWTWGLNTSGQLGNNDLASPICTPVTTVAGGTNWKQVACGTNHTAAIKTDGTLWTWGNNTSGQLGTNDLASPICTPVTTFAGGTTWSQLACGGAYSLAIKTDGTLWTWGSNTSGQLGTNDVPNLYPGQVFGGGTNWKQVAGWSPAQAIKTDGTLWTWGSNTSGQLGTNDLITRLTPVTTFAGGTNWKRCGEKGYITSVSAIKTDGTLWIWGSNATYGAVGTNDMVNRLTPVTTFLGGTNWKQVVHGYYHVVALTSGTDPTFFVS